MKVFLLSCIIICILSCATTDNGSSKYSKMFMKADSLRENPKVLQKNIHIVNSRRSLKSSKIKPVHFKTKNPLDKNKEYTAFPPINEIQKKLNAPDSAYFQVDENFTSKTRVKKVLPYYENKPLLRNRRSLSSHSADSKTNKTNTSSSKRIDEKKNYHKLRRNKSKIFLKGSSSSKTEKENKLAKNNELHTKSNAKRGSPTKTSRSKSSKKNRARSDDLKKKNKKLKAQKHKKTDRLKISLNYESEPTKLHKKHQRSRDGKNKKNELHKNEKDSNHKHSKIETDKKVNKITIKKHKKQAPKGERRRKTAQGIIPGKQKQQQKKVETRRLIGARDAFIEDFPYVVSIQKDEEHWCAGALLNQQLVITTANCIWKASRISRLRVRIGSRHTDRGGLKAKIQEVMKHPNWDIRKDPDNDIALLLLDRKIKFSDTVHAVDLPNRVMLPAFDDAWITSWGTERVYHARLMDRNKCNNVTRRFGVTVTENFICLAQTGKRAPCTRDTGAPAVSDGVLWGLASWGIRKLCGTERYPAVFSYMASHSNMDFIMNATHTLMAEERFVPFLDRYPVAMRATTSSSTYSTPEVF